MIANGGAEALLITFSTIMRIVLDVRSLRPKCELRTLAPVARSEYEVAARRLLNGQRTKFLRTFCFACARFECFDQDASQRAWLVHRPPFAEL